MSLSTLNDGSLFTLVLEPLKERSDYKEFEKRTDPRVAELRSIIESQLANLPKVWWSINEASK